MADKAKHRPCYVLDRFTPGDFIELMLNPLNVHVGSETG